MIAAVVLAGAAAWCATAVPGPARRAASIARVPAGALPGRPAGRGREGVRPEGPSRLRAWSLSEVWAASSAAAAEVPPLLVGALAGVLALGLLASPGGALVAAVVGLSAARAWRSRAVVRAGRAGSERVRRLLRSLVVELRSGAPPPLALRRSWSSPSDGRGREVDADGSSRSVVRSRRGGGTVAPHRLGDAPSRGGGPAGLLVDDVPALLRAAADDPGQSPLRRVAALWEVADATGAGLSDGLARLADELDEELELQREVETVLAGPRASARLMAALPLMGVLLGTGLGGDPVGFLLHDPLGQGCLLAGSALVLAGLRWTRALADAAEGRRPRRARG